MAKNLVVMGTSYGSLRQIAAVKSRAEFRRLLGPGHSDAFVKDYASETGNPAELVLANSFPGVLFTKPNDYSAEVWTRPDTGEKFSVALVPVKVA